MHQSIHVALSFIYLILEVALIVLYYTNHISQHIQQCGQIYDICFRVI
jgi:hypothetical protein